MRLTCTILFLTLVAGCARYEFDLVQPADHARHIGRNIDQVVKFDPLKYRLRTVEGRLVMRALNPTDDPIQLLGDKSVVVDPDGQSHPLLGQTIAPHSFIKLIFPPLRPRVYDPGPHFGVGVGVGVSHHHRRYPHHRSSLHDPWYHDRGPRYLYLEDESDSRYWDWPGQGETRVTLVYKRADKEFRHEFTFRRAKM